MSELFSVNFGVPQGSKAGPIIIIISMSDIVCCAPDLNTEMFADDTKIIFTNNTPVRIVQRTITTLYNLEL